MRREKQTSERDGDEPGCEQAGAAQVHQVLRVALALELEDGVVGRAGWGRCECLGHSPKIGTPAGGA